MMNLLELRLKFKSLTTDQSDMIEHLEHQLYHTETIRKAGIANGQMFSMVFFEDKLDNLVWVALVFPNGTVEYTDKQKPER
jgi:hypothetical protein